MPRDTKQIRRRRGDESFPPIAEIKTVLFSHIQTLIDSFAVPNEKNIRAIRAGRAWNGTLAQVQVKHIRHEIACLQRAIEIIESE